jgi:Ni,Fe-hydrogenase I small subunit
LPQDSYAKPAGAVIAEGECASEGCAVCQTGVGGQKRVLDTVFKGPSKNCIFTN